MKKPSIAGRLRGRQIELVSRPAIEGVWNLKYESHPNECFKTIVSSRSGPVEIISIGTFTSC